VQQEQLVQLAAQVQLEEQAQRDALVRKEWLEQMERMVLLVQQVRQGLLEMSRGPNQEPTYIM
jgi:hypothetical protein